MFGKNKISFVTRTDYQFAKETKGEWTIALIVSTVIFTIFLSLFIGIKGNYTEYNMSWMLVPTIISAIFVLKSLSIINYSSKIMELGLQQDRNNALDKELNTK